MTSLIHCTPIPTRAMRMFAILALLLTSFAGLSSPVTAQPAEPEPVDISLITREPTHGSLMVGACYQLVGQTDVGCDDDGDGQVGFDQIPPGTYTVTQTQPPAGLTAIDDFEIQVEAPYPGGSMGIVVKQDAQQNAPDTRNFSVILIDAATGERLVSDICVELVDAATSQCDGDLKDGQIDFVDVPAGVWELEFTNLGDNWVIGNGPSDVVRIDASAGTPTSQWVVRGIVVAPAAQEATPPPSTAGATLNITLRGCPEGIDPTTVNPATECTVPLDAPAEAGVVWGGDGQGGMPMTDVTRLDNGTYQVAVPSDSPLELVNFEPTVHDAYIAVGADAINDVGNPVVQLAPGTTGEVVIYYYTEVTADTWTASVQVMMCEGEMDCTGQAGIVVNISLASGEFLGSCTLSEPYPTPWGVDISTCNVDGMPFNADLVATQDPATIPAGYTPQQESISLHVDNLIPGGGDQATFTFVNMRTDQPAPSGSATVRITMRGCPEGFVPGTGDYFAECTIPLDAPDAAVILWGGDGQGGMEIMYLDREFDGAYVYQAGPNTMNLQLSGLAPTVRDDFEIFGTDGGDGSAFTINLANGEVREVYVFYYYYP